MTAVREQRSLLENPAVAGWVLRALLRDQAERARNGLTLPPFAQDVLAEIAAAADTQPPPRPDTGTDLATLGSVGGLVTVAAAADDTGKSAEYIRRLARLGNIRHRRLGPRALMIDLASLRGYLAERDTRRNPR